MLRFLTAGETHGKALVGILEGLPSNMAVETDKINEQLKLRQGGYGRGGRMKIETDRVEILSGVRNSRTMGGPVALMIKNRDYENWEAIMNTESAIFERMVTAPRAGHADLSGAIKYNQEDIRCVLERASARETAMRVAIGALARQIIESFGITVTGYVKSIGSVKSNGDYRTKNFEKNIKTSQFRFADLSSEEEAKALIDKCKEDGESVGGVIETAVRNAPVGLGSFVHCDRKLDAQIAMAVMGIQAIKGVSFGLGFETGEKLGSKVHDQIGYDGKQFVRETNNAGGIEGGMSNGETIVVSAVMKPIPTLYTPLASVDIKTKEKVLSDIERSDICAVPAASVVMENVVAFEIAKAFLDKFGGDSIQEITENYKSYKKYVEEF